MPQYTTAGDVFSATAVRSGSQLNSYTVATSVTTGGIAALRHGTGPVVRPPQPSAWAMALGHVLPGDRQRPGGRSAAPVAEAERHGP